MTSETAQPAPGHDGDFAAMRRAMVESQLRPSDVSDPVVIGAMAVTPREDFVPDERRAIAYMDRAVPLGGGRYLNPPLGTGLLLDRADLASADTVLLIGGGTGYVAAVIAPLVARVTLLESDAGLAAVARERLARFGNVAVVEGPLNEGHADAAPYSLIIVDGAAEALPDALAAQLAEDGRLVTGLAAQGIVRLAIGRRAGHGFTLTGFADSDLAELPAFAARRQYAF